MNGLSGKLGYLHLWDLYFKKINMDSVRIGIWVALFIASMPVMSTAKMVPDTSPVTMSGTLPQDEKLTEEQLFRKMMTGAHKLIEKHIAESKQGRMKYWNREFSSRAEYDKSVLPNRQRLRHYLGVEDKTLTFTNYNIGIPDENPPPQLLKYSNDLDPKIVAETERYTIFQVRWTVLEGVNGEGLLVQPKEEIKAHLIAIPDADQIPGQLLGLVPGVPEESQFARHLAENGFQILIPMLVNREPIMLSGNNVQSHREWLYRQAFHMGRHIIGYEVQKILSAVDWFEKMYENPTLGVIGYGEGGLIAFYTAAIDNRIDGVLVSGYFDSREKLWKEPIYRNVWGLLTEFGDAEIASLIAPRPLVVEYSEVPPGLNPSSVPDPFSAFHYTGFKGSVQTPSFATIENEFSRISELIPEGFQQRFLSHANRQPLPFGSTVSLKKFLELLGLDDLLNITTLQPEDLRTSFHPDQRQFRQIKEIETHVQKLLRVSDSKRNQFYLHKVMPEFANRKWNTDSYVPYYTPEKFIEQSNQYRKYFSEEILGNFSEELLPSNARTRKIYDTERWVGYEVILDVYDEFIAAGILLIPNNIEDGVKRPAVVVQHGRNGIPKIVVEGNTSYYDIGARLVTQGFVVFAPYGLFKGEDQYRWLDRKANGVKKTLFSFIVAQHRQILNWLETLPFVEGEKIGFYGKSYGGETAMRIPAVIEKYALSICSADFGDWTRKVVDVYDSHSFMKSIEWEMPYFNMGSTFSYAEMAYLIFPRPFMVERGHHDLVQPDEWVLYEYGKVHFLYDQFNKVDKTSIEIFNGGHASRNVGTFEFLRKHLNWP